MEGRRQAFHALVGIALIACILALGPETMKFAVLLLFLVGIVVVHQKLVGSRIPIADEMLMAFERPHQPPAHGAFWYAVGVMLIMSFLQAEPEIIACIYVLAVPDAVSTLAGLRSSHPLPYNKTKSIEGSLAFFVFSLPAYLAVGPVAIPLAIVATLVESADLRLNDNLTVPLACVVVLSLV
ncbi:MAG: hypothetical protein NT157_04065 [Candidatus Micrarchaeota archaeon]|nr:hypothetical protein [Candidatus Micrarchaeota archaeon]